MKDHKYKEEFIIKRDYEIRNFWFFHYKKRIAEQIIPTRFCAVCHKLDIEHQC